MLVEIKDGKKPRSARKLTEDQEKFWGTWKGGVRLIDGLEAVAETVNTLKLWKRKLSA